MQKIQGVKSGFIDDDGDFVSFQKKVDNGIAPKFNDECGVKAQDGIFTIDHQIRMD